MPVTAPPTSVATAVLLLAHVPPAREAVRETVEAGHITSEPESDGVAITLTTAVDRQPPGIVYDILEVPAATPFTIPAVPIVATAAELLVHVPPAFTLARAIVDPAHTLPAPVIAARGLTVTTFVCWQPVLNV
jgi:hypothetical protein